MEPLAGLIAASLAFVGTHFALSHPLRGALVRAAGASGFAAIYSLVAFATLGWMAFAFRAVPPAAPLWNGMGEAPWGIATLLMLAASVLLVGSFSGNPALPAPNAIAAAAGGPRGVLHVTRHPMMWSFALWSASHGLVSPTPRVLVLAFAILFLALVGAHLQDRKKEALMGADWTAWEARTSYWPKLRGFAQAGAVPWLGGLALWLGATWSHIPAIGVPAGLWRWLA